MRHVRAPEVLTVARKQRPRTGVVSESSAAWIQWPRRAEREVQFVTGRPTSGRPDVGWRYGMIGATLPGPQA